MARTTQASPTEMKEIDEAIMEAIKNPESIRKAQTFKGKGIPAWVFKPSPSPSPEEWEKQSQKSQKRIEARYGLR